MPGPTDHAARPAPRELHDATAGLQAWVEVDLDALDANVRAIVARARPARLGMVVKADAYGHGIEVAAVAGAAAGAACLVVATLEEGLAVRAAGVSADILVIYPVPLAGLTAAARAGLTISVNGKGPVEALARTWGRLPDEVRALDLRVQIEVDTGMGRDGATPDEVVPAARILDGTPGLLREGTWSHLASAEHVETSHAQAVVFERVLAQMEANGIDPRERHLAASGALLCRTVPEYDLVRIGMACYGLAPGPLAAGDPDLAARLRPALSLRARPVRVVDVPAGARIGYGGKWEAPRPSRIATVTVGYGDGFARSSSPGATALVRGRRTPVVGRVSMDAITVDVTEAGDVGAGDEIVLIGHQGDEHAPATDLAAVRGTTAWEVLATLGPRLARLYLRSGSVVAVREPGAGGRLTWS